jgi:hypothetical protein
MSYSENSEREKSKRQLRTFMDLFMGVFYVFIGGVVFFVQSFGGMVIPPLVAYILGGMMMVGGAFRFVKGVKAAMPGKPVDEQEE